MKYKAPYGSLDPNAPYVDKDTPAAVAGSKVPRQAVEAPQRELHNLIVAGGLEPDHGDLNQVGKAIQTGKIIFAAAAGVANALTATLSPAPAAYVAGMAVRLKTPTTNTGPATLDLNGLGPVPIVRLDGSPLVDSDFITDGMAELVCDGAKFVHMGTAGQPQLKRALNYYVNASIGNDANDGGANTAGQALKTLTEAINRAFAFGPSGYIFTINLANGSYAGVRLPTRGGPELNIVGNASSPSSVVLVGGTGSGFRVEGSNIATIQGCKASTGGSSQPGFAAGGGVLNVIDCETGVCSGAALQAIGNATLNSTRHRFQGNSVTLFTANNGGQITISGQHILQNTLSVSSASANASSNGTIACSPNNPPSFLNPSYVAGQRYSASLNGTITTQGGGANFFPGTTAGSTATGGQYA